MGPIVFFSDVHLSSSALERTEALLKLLQKWKDEKVEAIYILGDLFNYWFSPQQAYFPEVFPILKQIKKMSYSGIFFYFVPGNRDFLVGKYLEKNWGIKTLKEIHFLCLENQLFFLSHGDIFLTSNKRDQIFRKIIQHPIIRGLAKIIPPKMVQYMARALRRNSKKNTQKKNPSTFSFDWSCILNLMTPATISICGHIHKPNIYKIYSASGIKHLYTLGDWSKKTSYLIWKNGHLTFYENDL